MMANRKNAENEFTENKHMEKDLFKKLIEKILEDL
jgi:hypothetical protein